VARNLPYAEGVVKAKILGINGITAIQRFSIVVSGQRQATIDVSVKDVDGDVTNIKLPVP
jgi:hypothetical protein